jgi:hypothetical protein
MWILLVGGRLVDWDLCMIVVIRRMIESSRLVSRVVVGRCVVVVDRGFDSEYL